MFAGSLIGTGRNVALCICSVVERGSLHRILCISLCALWILHGFLLNVPQNALLVRHGNGQLPVLVLGPAGPSPNSRAC